MSPFAMTSRDHLANWIVGGLGFYLYANYQHETKKQDANVKVECLSLASIKD